MAGKAQKAKAKSLPPYAIGRPKRFDSRNITCPSHDNYADPQVRAWAHDHIEHSQQDIDIMTQLYQKDQNGRYTHPAFQKRTPIERAVEAYEIIPQSFKDQIWRVAADNLIANYHDATITPDTHISLLPTEMKDYMWSAEVCVSMCPEGLCPWADDSDAFNRRKSLWDQQRKNSQICHDRWVANTLYREKQQYSAARKAARLAKKEALRVIMIAERKLSLTMFHPKEISGAADMIAEIQGRVATYVPYADPILARMIRAFPSTTRVSLLDFQCLIADYFHDGMPGFRITNKNDPKISGIRVHHPDIIRLGKEKHHMFMYQFLTNILHIMDTQQVPQRLVALSDELKRLNYLRLPTLTQQPKVTPGDALDAWRKMIDLTDTRVEDSINKLLEIPNINIDSSFIDLKKIKKSNPWIEYDNYLKGGKQVLTIKIGEDETKTLTRREARRIVIFLLLVLFGPSYRNHINLYPALFTFDAHKGHINRIISKANISFVYRLVTPYNVADSAMTEQFAKPVAPVMSALEAAELAEIEAEVDAEEAGSKVTDEDVHEEEETDDIVPVGNQAGAQRCRTLFAFSLRQVGPLLPQVESSSSSSSAMASSSSASAAASAAPSAAGLDVIASNTNMIFDNNWLIYYKDLGFTQLQPYNLSMNIADAGLYRYLQSKRHLISPSLYTIEAPFSAEATRGPSLNYLMMGLLRGSMSDVFTKKKPFESDTELYDALLARYNSFAGNADLVQKLLPIYSIPVSSHALPLFQHIANAPLFAYHMLYDLQHRISALPSRIKWAGDREQYMALQQDLSQSHYHGVFVTLDTTGYFCALANGIKSLLERKDSIKVVGVIPSQSEIAEAHKEAQKASQDDPMWNDGMGSDEEDQGAASSTGPKATVPKGKSAKKKGGAKSLDMKLIHTRKNVRVSLHGILDRDYFFLGWLYPLVMAVNEAFHDRHPAEEAYVILHELSDHVHHPGLFPILQGQFLHAVSRIPHASKELMASVKELTAETYESNTPQCASLLKEHYTVPSSIFSNPIHKRTLLGYLIEMKQALSARYSSKDSTMDLLHALLIQEDQEKACLVLALLFERLHGRIQSGTSYLGQILGITGGPVLERVDDQAAWEHLTTVMEEDMVRIAVSTNASVKTAAATAANAPANVAALPALATPPNTRRISAKLRRVNRGPAFRKMNNAFTQLRSNRALRAPKHAPLSLAPTPTRASTRPSRVSMTQNARRLVMGGSLKKTRRAKERRDKRSRRKD
jgi:hypothetical protein